ncbi:MAG: hypothetical protein JSR76_03715 [Verrucomicrobia bacterium]|nr:hypothetical protein [Verrucomicrobiota bacterium]
MVSELKKIEETIDSLLECQSMLNRCREKKAFSLESASLEKMVESLTARLRFLVKDEKMNPSSTRGLRYRIQSKASLLQKICTEKKAALPLLLSSLKEGPKLRKKRLKSIPK